MFSWLKLDLFARSVSIESSRNVKKYPANEVNVLGSMTYAAFMAIVFGSELLSIYYLMTKIFNVLERLWYNEGWLQAIMPFFCKIVIGIVAVLLVSEFLITPLLELAWISGVVSPKIILSIGMTFLNFLGMSGGFFATEQFQKYFNMSFNADAIDPKEPHRFALTPT